MKSLKQLLRIVVVVLLFATTTSFVFWLKRSATSIEQHHLPAVIISSVDITGIASERVNMLAQFEFNNNESAGFLIDSIDYTIFVAGEHVVSKTYKKSIDIRSFGSALLTLPVDLKYENLNTLFADLHKAGKDSAQMKVNMVLYSNRIPTRSKKIYIVKSVPVVSLPDMRVQKMELDKYSDAGSIINVVVLMRNANAEPLFYKDAVCDVTFKEYKTINTRLQHVIKIPAKGSVRVVVPVAMSETDARNLMAKGKNVRYIVKMTAKASSKKFKNNNVSIRAYGKTEVIQEVNYEL